MRNLLAEQSVRRLRFDEPREDLRHRRGVAAKGDRAARFQQDPRKLALRRQQFSLFDPATELPRGVVGDLFAAQRQELAAPIHELAQRTREQSRRADSRRLHQAHFLDRVEFGRKADAQRLGVATLDEGVGFGRKVDGAKELAALDPHLGQSPEFQRRRRVLNEHWHGFAKPLRQTFQVGGLKLHALVRVGASLKQLGRTFNPFLIFIHVRRVGVYIDIRQLIHSRSAAESPDSGSGM